MERNWDMLVQQNCSCFYHLLLISVVQYTDICDWVGCIVYTVAGWEQLRYTYYTSKIPSGGLRSYTRGGIDTRWDQIYCGLNWDAQRSLGIRWSTVGTMHNGKLGWDAPQGCNPLLRWYAQRWVRRTVVWTQITTKEEGAITEGWRPLGLRCIGAGHKSQQRKLLSDGGWNMQDKMRCVAMSKIHYNLIPVRA